MLLSCTLTVLLVLSGLPEVQPAQTAPEVYMISGLFSPGISLTESDRPIYQVTLTLLTFRQGRGEGKLELGRNPPAYTELGFTEGTTGGSPPLRLECAVKFLKTVKVAYHVGHVREDE